jgi:hypothetical protein
MIRIRIRSIRSSVEVLSQDTGPPASVNPPARNVAECAADQNRNYLVLADLSRKGTGRATTRINDVLRHTARLRPSLPCRVAGIAQHFFAWRAAAIASSTIFWAWPAAVALFALSPIASPAFVTRASKESGLSSFLRPTSPLPRELLTLRSSGGDQPVAYLNSGSILSPSLVPPSSVTLLPAKFSVS